MAKKQKTVTPLYRDSVDELLYKGKNVTKAARRDLDSHLADYGHTTDSIKEIEDAGQALSEMPTDEEFVGVLVEKTAIKDQLADEVRSQIDGIISRASSFYGPTSGKVRRYGAEKLSKMTDGQLWQCAKRTVRVGTTQLDELKAKGLTQQHLDTLLATAGKFDAARDEQDDAVRDRDIATQERITAGNAYFTKLQPLMADAVAKLGPVDEARANDYVWDPSPETTDDTLPTPPTP